MIEFENHALSAATLLPYAGVFAIGMIVGIGVGAFAVYRKLK